MATTKRSTKAQSVDGTNSTVTTGSDGEKIISGLATNEEAAADPQEAEGAYGTRHIMEEQMRAAGMGAFGDTKAERGAPANKSK